MSARKILEVKVDRNADACCKCTGSLQVQMQESSRKYLYCITFLTDAKFSQKSSILDTTKMVLES